MGDEERGTQAEVDGLRQYQQRYFYPGQWFDDMGSLAMMMGDSHSVGVELAESHLDRDETNRLASLLMEAPLNPYE